MALDAAALEALITKIDAAIEAIIDGGAIQAHEINGRQVTRYSLDQLVRLRDQYKKQLTASKGPQRNLTTFGKPE